MTVGIYSISYKDKKYYGSSKNIEKRWEGHKKSLSRHTHHNIYIQRIYDAHGIESFEFDIVEICEQQDLHVIEQKYIDLNVDGLNLAPACGGDIMSSHPNRTAIVSKISETSRLNRSKMTPAERKEVFGKPGELNGMFGKTHSEETRGFLSGYNKGRKPIHRPEMTPELRHKLSIGQKKTYENGRIANMKGGTHSEKTLARLRELSMNQYVLLNETQLKVFDVFDNENQTSTIYFGASGIKRDFNISPAIVSLMTAGRIFKRGNASKYKIRVLSLSDIDNLIAGSYVKQTSDKFVMD